MLPLFFPPPMFVKQLPQLGDQGGEGVARSLTVKELCNECDVPCAASGAWVNRRIQIIAGEALATFATPGPVGDVLVVLPSNIKSPVTQSRMALGVMAYALLDLVARQSIRGAAWARPVVKGRPRTGRAKSVAQRQRKFRLSKATGSKPQAL